MVSASSLLLPSSVRDFASCIGDGAVRVADVAACTAPSSTRTSTCSASSTTASPTLSVTVSYRATLLLADGSSTPPPPLHLRLTWGHSPVGPTLSFAPSATARAIQLHRRRGSRSVPTRSGSGDEDGGGEPTTPSLALFWDLTAARYDPAGSPEPVCGYYVVAVASAEVVLAVGDLAAEFVKAKFEGQVPRARIAPVSRVERVVVSDPAAMHAARVRFAEGGPEHEVSVSCGSPGSGSGGGGDELWVCVDGKRAVQACRLRWNFRGNQTVFVDGAPVDVMWDLHGWWFRETPGCAVVMLRARSALESRLWLEEEAAAPGFSLIVQAFKTPP
ncbi:hypothetical protein E2562_024373 [Oryza meyeriana var. granulata]|uniref:DUF868 domain-containing protein n=1 Tax=Oryza meyeriana var. granulata TaxID=110450 RepID=A0A6G1C769_9ORYZ|nr:hypothetical protein E2562_024373 [Oryza meyeriana var. granulata]